MSAITALLTRNCRQTAVYWGSPQEDGYGGRTFAAPVEISCRWSDQKETVSGSNGTQILCRASVHLLQDVDEEGYLFLGTIEDLYDMTTGGSSAGGIDNPKDFELAQEIIRFTKIPALDDATVFVRKAYLI